MEYYLVHNWMSHPVLTVSRSTTLPEARRIMQEAGIRHLPVLDGGQLAGIVTWGDIRRASPSDATTLSVWEITTLLDRIVVAQIMTRSPITVAPDTTIAQAAHIMLDHKIGGLPVLSGDRLVGILTEADLCRVLMALQPGNDVLQAVPTDHLSAVAG
jgi:CBS domain-containing protein